MFVEKLGRAGSGNQFFKGVPIFLNNELCPCQTVDWVGVAKFPDADRNNMVKSAKSSRVISSCVAKGCVGGMRDRVVP